MLWGHKKKYILDMKESQNRKNHRKNHINHMPKLFNLQIGTLILEHLSKGNLIPIIDEKLKFRVKFVGLGLNTWKKGHQQNKTGYL